MTMNSEQFCKTVSRDVFSGYGFVPFVGSGLSAASGILMGQEFGNFLAYCVYKVAGCENPHDIVREGWPKYPRDEEVEETKVWTFNAYKKLCGKYDCKPNQNKDGLVDRVDFRPVSDNTARHIWSAQRPLIPQVIRASDKQTWNTERQTKIFQEQNRKDFEWGVSAQTGHFSRTSNDYFVEQAIRSMHDWRSVLAFLSQVSIDEKRRRTLLEHGNHSVIDSFNVHITQDRQINLGHKMLAHLSNPMRIRTVLTTNFDSLTESAFAKLHFPLSVVTVSSRGELPNARVVRSKNSIVKLHGELSETRADFTLDQEPTLQDRETFANYVRGEFDSVKQTEAIPNHLFVVGFSGRDVRIIQMMKYLLDTRPNVKIYWICHSKSEPNEVLDRFGEEYTPRIIIQQTERPDLLLYELYQYLTLTLPSGGFSYQFTHKVPPETIVNGVDDQAEINTIIDEGATLTEKSGYGLPRAISRKKLARQEISSLAGTKISSFIKLPTSTEQNGVCRLPEKKSSVEIRAEMVSSQLRRKQEFVVKLDVFSDSVCASSMRFAFNDLSTVGYHCLWIELQDYASPGEVLQDVLRIIALRVGSYQLEHLVLNPYDDQSKEGHLARLIEYLDISAGRWVVFFYGRSVPGAASGWENEAWVNDDYCKFHEHIQSLNKCGIHTVHAPITKDRIEKEKKRISNVRNTSERKIGTLDDQYCPMLQQKFTECTNEKHCLDEKYQEIIESISDQTNVEFPDAMKLGIFDGIRSVIVDKWLKPEVGDEDENVAKEQTRNYYRRLQFLYASTLFRQSRHVSAFFSDAVYRCPHRFNVQCIDNDWTRSLNVKKWIEQLGSLDVFFYKPGGYSWKYRDVRIGIQETLESLPLFRLHNSIAKQIFAATAWEEKDIQNWVKNDLKPIAFAIQLRSKMHSDIALWYMKAFNSTGHYLPFIESMYHHIECIRNIKFSHPASFSPGNSNSSLVNTHSPNQISSYRIAMVRASVFSMIKALRSARPWLKFWLSSVDGHAIFDSKIIKTLDGYSSELNKERGQLNEEINAAKASLESELSAVQSSLKSEAGVFGNSYYRTEQFPSEDPEFFSFRFEMYKRRCDKDRNTPKPPQISVGTETNVFKSNFLSGFETWFSESPFADWFQEKNNNQYPLAEVFNSIKDIHDNSTEFNQKRLQETLSRSRAEWVSKNIRSSSQTKSSSKPRFDNSAALFVVELFADLAYAFVKRAKLERAVTNNYSSLRRRWLQVTVSASFAISICRHLHPSILDRERRLEIKLTTLYGLGLSHLGRPIESNRKFNEAAALLSKESRIPDEVETAIIRLRRAEAVLVRAENLGMLLDCLPVAISEIDNGLSNFRDSHSGISAESQREIHEWQCNRTSWNKDDLIAQWKKRIEEKLNCKLRDFLNDEPINDPSAIQIDPTVESSLKELYNSASNDSTEELRDSIFRTLSRIHSSFLSDCWVYIESAERLLAGHSQSTLWWGRVASLKLRTYASIRGDAIYESLVFRRRLQHDSQVLVLRDRLLLIDPSSGIAKARCVELTARAMQAVSTNSFGMTSYTRDDWLELSNVLVTSLGILYKIIDKDKDGNTNDTTNLLLARVARATKILFDCMESSMMPEKIIQKRKREQENSQIRESIEPQCINLMNSVSEESKFKALVKTITLSETLDQMKKHFTDTNTDHERREDLNNVLTTVCYLFAIQNRADAIRLFRKEA